MAITNVDPQAPVRNYFSDSEDIEKGFRRFLYWFDFKNRQRMHLASGHVYAVGTRPESLVNTILPINSTAGDYQVLGTIHGKQALVIDADNYFTGTVPVSPVSELTFFIVLSGASGSRRIMQAGAVEIDTNRTTVGGGNATYGSTSLSLAVNDGVPHILVFKWDAGSGDAYCKVDDSVMDLIATGLTTVESNSTSFTIGASSSSFVGKLGEIMLAGVLFDNDEINEIGNYLCNKWQIRWSNV